MEDHKLLADYARTGSEAAFSLLVKRHVGFVHAVARRQLNDDALAADVAQAVFLLLSRKAGSFGSRSVLVGWLFRTTRFVASRALRAEMRRQRREQEAVAMQQLHSPDPHWNRFSPELDEAVARLGETDRNALLLRFAEGRNHREVGAILGLSEEAAKKRVNRALEMLRGKLAGRGVTLTAVVLAGLLTDHLNAAPPAGLAASIAQGVAPGAASAGVAGLMQQTVTAWRWARVKFAAACVSMAALVAALLLPVSPSGPQSNAAGAAGQTLQAASTPNPASAAHTPGVPPRLNGTETFRLQVVAAETGHPLPGARVQLNFVSNGEWITPEDLESDANGLCMIPLPRGALMRLDVGAHFPGYENRFFTWKSRWQHACPDGYSLKLGRGETVGGQVVDERQQPLTGVSVWLDYHLSDTSWREPEEDRERVGFMRRFRLGVTDTQGRWICSTIPPSREHYAFEFEHPDFVKHESTSVSLNDETAAGRATLGQLRARKLVTVMQAGAVAHGQVVNGSGEPVTGARIGRSWHEPLATTDTEGQFTVKSLPRGDVSLTATAEGFAPKRFQAEAGGGAARVTLESGTTLRARLVNTNAEAIAGGRLVLEGGFDQGSFGWDGTSDEDGQIEWRSAPPGRALTFTAHAPGYRYHRHFPLVADGTEQTVTLHPTLEVVGSVVDAQTGQPIDRFKAIPGEGHGNPNFDRSELHYGTGGHYRLSFEEMGAPVVRLEAEGYEPEIGYPRPGAAGEPRCDFRMRRLDLGAGVQGLVVNTDGSPAADAEVALCGLEHAAMLGRGRFLDRTRNLVTNADASGRFRFPVIRVPHTVVAVSARGFGRASVLNSNRVEIRLEPFGVIEGRLLRDGQPLAGRSVLLSDPAYGHYRGAMSLDVAAFSTQTDGTGAFRISDVPAGEFLLFQNPGVGQAFLDQTVASVIAGQTTTVVMGQPDPSGRTVVGQLKASKPVSGNWRQLVTVFSFTRKLAGPQPPADLAEEARQLWLVAWHQSAAGAAWLRQSVRYDVQVAADGRFTIRGVVPGEYELWLRAVPEDMLRTDPWRVKGAPWTGYVQPRPVIVPRGESGDATALFDLGEVEVTIQRRAQ